jgi:hypothetical protein
VSFVLVILGIHHALPKTMTTQTTTTKETTMTITARIAPVFAVDVLADTISPEIVGIMTTEHAASSYGMPVLVTDDGTAYGPGDMVGRRLHLGDSADDAGLARAERIDAAYAACKAAGWQMED